MAIPEFNKRGTLEKGIHQCTAQEFFQRFCLEDDNVRKNYKEVLEQIFALSVHRGVNRIIIAGSFITDKKEPNDLDCIIVFPNEENVSLQVAENLLLEGCELDVMCVAESNKQLIYSLINMFALDKYGLEVGLVEVVLELEKDGSTWRDYEEYNSLHKLMEARAAYIFRHIIRGTPKKKVLVTVCNLDQYWHWNYEIAPIVSSSGWIFAPFVYSSIDVGRYLDFFIAWIKDIYYAYETELCVYADGLGTYLIGKYLKADDVHKNIYFDKIILSKSLIDPGFNWRQEIDSSRVKLLINLRDAHNKCKIIEKIDKKIKNDALLGESYKHGFHREYKNLIDYKYDYKNEIRADEFKNNILPIFHLSEALIKNHEREQLNNLAEFAEIMRKELSLIDIIKKGNDLS